MGRRNEVRSDRLLADLLSGAASPPERVRRGDEGGRGWTGTIREARLSLDLHAPPPWRYLLQTLRHLHGTFLLVPALVCTEPRPLSPDDEGDGRAFAGFVETLRTHAEDRGLPLLAIREEGEALLPAQVLAHAGFHALEGAPAFRVHGRRSGGEEAPEGIVVQALPPSALAPGHRRLLLERSEVVDPLFEVPSSMLWESLRTADASLWRLFEARGGDGRLLAWCLACREGDRGRVPLSAWSLDGAGPVARAGLDGPCLRWVAEQGGNRLVVEPPLPGEPAGGERLVRRLHLRHRSPAMRRLIRSL